MVSTVTLLVSDSMFGKDKIPEILKSDTCLLKGRLDIISRAMTCLSTNKGCLVSYRVFERLAHGYFIAS